MNRELVSIDDWSSDYRKSSVVGGRNMPDESIVCAVSQAHFTLMKDDLLITSKSVDQESLLDGGQMRHIISDETIDRHGDIVRANGWDISNYKKNPIILWAHDHSQPPIGKSLRIIKRSKEKQLVSIGEYPSAALYEFANTAFRLAVNGFLNAVSVGFMPKEYEALDEEAPWKGYDITKQELWEYSIVPVPANPNALQNAAHKMPGGPAFVKRWAEQILDTASIPDDLEKLIEATDAVAGHRVTVSMGDGDSCEELIEVSELKDISFDLQFKTITDKEIADEDSSVIAAIASVSTTVVDQFEKDTMRVLAEKIDNSFTNQATRDHEEDAIVEPTSSDDPIIFKLVAEPTFDIEESVITNLVADAVTKVTGRLIDREE